jgi:glycosyltransferase 2 family protein
MRSHVRTIVVLALAVGLIALFFRQVDLWRVASDIVRARPEWLALSLAMSTLKLAIQALRWQYLLEPLGHTSFMSAFRATAVGFAASSILPARAGEVIRPYFLARTEKHQERMTATGAFATIILERLLDVLTVLVLLASYVFVFGRDLERTNPMMFVGLKWAGGTAAVGSVGALVVLFVLAGDPERLRRTMERLERVLPSTFAGLVARIAEKFARGLAAIRRPSRLLVAIAWSFPVWLSICVGIWAAAVAFQIAVPFTGSFLILALLVLGVAVPTPGAVGGFHAAFRYGATTFFAAPDDAAVGAAIVLHLFSIVPSLLLGLLFAAQEGLNVGGMRRLADQAEQGRPA